LGRPTRRRFGFASLPLRRGGAGRYAARIDVGRRCGVSAVGTPRVTVLARCTVEIDGVVHRPTPTQSALLIRLVLAEGQPVPLAELADALWPRDTGVLDVNAKQRRQRRTNVQRNVSELRRLLDAEHSGEASELIRTETGRVTQYRLMVARDRIDL